MEMMKCLVIEEPNVLNLQLMHIPKIRPNEVLIKVMASGICGTEPKFINGEFPCKMPVVLGHEYAGKVVEVGSEVTIIKPGDRVTVDPNEPCMKCYYCRRGMVNCCTDQKPYGVLQNGGFAEYSAVPETVVYKIPDSMSYEEAAMIEPLACCLRGIQIARMEIPKSALVLGGGPMGNMIIQLARIFGACPIILSEPIQSRREMGKKAGADYVFDPSTQEIEEEVKKLFPEGVEVVFEVTGNIKVASTALNFVRKRGMLQLFGAISKGDKMEIEPYILLENEISITSSLNNPFTHAPSIDLVASGRIDVKSIVSHTFSIDDYKKAFEMHGKPGTMKIQIKPNI